MPPGRFLTIARWWSISRIHDPSAHTRPLDDIPAVTNVVRASHDLFLAQRFARHVSPLTTTVYTHQSDQEMYEKVRGLRC